MIINHLNVDYMGSFVNFWLVIYRILVECPCIATGLKKLRTFFCSYYLSIFDIGQFSGKQLHMKLGTWNHIGTTHTSYHLGTMARQYISTLPHLLFIACTGPTYFSWLKRTEPLLGYLFLEGHEINHLVRSFVIVNGIYN